MGYSSDYANNIGRIYSDLGQAQAQGALGRGQAWANAFGQIGQIATNLPGQIQDAKVRDTQSKLYEQNLARLAEQRQEDEWLRQAMNASVVNGEIDEGALTNELTRMGAAQLIPSALAPIREAKTKLLELKRMEMAGEADTQVLAQQATAALLPYAKVLKVANFEPAVVKGALAAVRIQFGAGLADRLEQQITQNPQGLPQLVDRLIAQENLMLAEDRKKSLINVAEGGVVFDPSTQQPVYENEKPQTPLTLTEQFAAATTDAERARIARLMRQEAQAKHIAPAPSTTRYQRADVTLPDGTTALANYDSQTGKYTNVDTGQVLSGVTGAPTAEQRNKAAAREDAMGMVEMLRQLSDRIIQRVGPTQRADAARRGVAAVFGTDPEFRVYQDLRYSLAMNLAVMQQGSKPTDPDVQKGALPVVPDPFSDTTESAQMKWDYVDKIVKGKAKLKTGGTGADPLGIRK